jgi:hypothetical protein
MRTNFYVLTSRTTTIVGKIVVIALTILTLFLFDEQQITLNPFFYPAIMLLESLVFVNSILPFGFISVALAQNLLLSGNFFLIIIGYFAALTANILSYTLGLSVTKESDSRPASITPMLITFWHPQTASVEGFDSGVYKIPLKDYLIRAIPVSLMCYSVVCAILMHIPLTLDLHTTARFSLYIMVIWVSLEIVHAWKPTLPILRHIL